MMPLPGCCRTKNGNCTDSEACASAPPRTQCGRQPRSCRCRRNLRHRGKDGRCRRTTRAPSHEVKCLTAEDWTPHDRDATREIRGDKLEMRDTHANSIPGKEDPPTNEPNTHREGGKPPRTGDTSSHLKHPQAAPRNHLQHSPTHNLREKIKVIHEDRDDLREKDNHRPPSIEDPHQDRLLTRKTQGPQPQAHRQRWGDTKTNLKDIRAATSSNRDYLNRGMKGSTKDSQGREALAPGATGPGPGSGGTKQEDKQSRRSPRAIGPGAAGGPRGMQRRSPTTTGPGGAGGPHGRQRSSPTATGHGAAGGPRGMRRATGHGAAGGPHGMRRRTSRMAAPQPPPSHKPPSHHSKFRERPEHLTSTPRPWQGVGTAGRRQEPTRRRLATPLSPHLQPPRQPRGPLPRNLQGGMTPSTPATPGGAHSRMGKSCQERGPDPDRPQPPGGPAPTRPGLPPRAPRRRSPPGTAGEAGGMASQGEEGRAKGAWKRNGRSGVFDKPSNEATPHRPQKEDLEEPPPCPEEQARGTPPHITPGPAQRQDQQHPHRRRPGNPEPTLHPPPKSSRPLPRECLEALPLRATPQRKASTRGVPPPRRHQIPGGPRAPRTPRPPPSGEPGGGACTPHRPSASAWTPHAAPSRDWRRRFGGRAPSQ